MAKKYKAFKFRLYPTNDQLVLLKKAFGCVRFTYNQKRKVARLQGKTANQRRDLLHKKSYALANKYDAVAIEDLDMKGMSKALKFGKSVSDNGWGIFTTFLQYKFEDRGKSLIKVDKWFPSSKMCSKCENVKEKLPLSERRCLNRWFSGVSSVNSGG